MAGNIMAHPADGLVLGSDGCIVLLLHGNLRLQELVFRAQGAPLRHAPDSLEQRRIRCHTDRHGRQHQ